MQFHRISAALCALVFVACGDNPRSAHSPSRTAPDPRPERNAPELAPARPGTETQSAAAPRGEETQPPEDREPNPPDEEPPDPREPDVLSVTAFSPSTAFTTGGTPAVVVGEAFPEDAVVYVGTRRLMDQTWRSPTQITGVLPPGSLGAVDVKVTSELGDDLLADALTYVAPLQVGSVTPATADARGRTTLLVEGSGFSPDSLVTVGGRLAIETRFVDEQTLLVTAPPGDAGYAIIWVTRGVARQRWGGALRYFEPVHPERVFPAAGGTEGGVTVEIHGTGLGQVDRVTFGGIDAALGSVAPDRILAVVPPGPAGPVDVVVEDAHSIRGLPGAFHYFADQGGPRLVSITPAFGETRGGETVAITGNGLADPELRLTLGGGEVSVVARGEHSILARTPPGHSGAVDLAIRGTEHVLEDAFEYEERVLVDWVSSASGPQSGGRRVVVEGAGFGLHPKVFFGPMRARVVFNRAGHLEVITPPGPLGSVDIVVERGRMRGRFEDGYRYEADSVVTGISPSHASVAGGTFVTITGTGFERAPESVWFGHRAATQIELVDQASIRVRTPAVLPGAVSVHLDFGDERLTAPDQFLFYNPRSRYSGVWGPQIQGSLHVAVVDADTGRPLPGAWVTLGDGRTRHSSSSDGAGLTTFSGPDLTGRQTVTAAAEDYAASTIVGFNAENVTLRLHPYLGGHPLSPPTGTIRGRVTGLDKLVHEAEDLLAWCETTRASPFRSKPATGGGNVVLGDGDYTLISRVGDVAVWCVGGRYDALTDTFHPLAMGIRRSLYVGRGAEIVADVALDIPLRERADLKIIGAPRGNPGPDQNFAMVYVDLGYEGVIDAFEPVSADDELLTLAHLPALAGALEGAEFWVWGGAETAGRRTPYSVSFGPTIPETGLLAELGPLLPVPAPVNPVRMGRVESGYIEWSTARPTPDLWRVRISSWNSILRWEVFVPGEQPFVHLPEFPGMDEVLDPRAVPSPRGDAWVSVTAFDIQDFQYDAMEYRDLNRPRPRAVSSAYWPVVFP